MRGGRSTNGKRPRLLGGAAFLCLALLLAACQPSTSSTSAAPSPGGSSGAASQASSASAAPAERLAAALATMANGYTYDTTVTVAGKAASHARGRWVGGAGEFVLESGGQAVTYRAIPPRAWVQKSGAAWVEVTSQQPTGNPLDALATPAATQVVSDASGVLVIDATYPASALGLSGTKAVTVRTTLAADGSVTATYTTDTSAGKAASTTVLVPASGLKPIVAP